MESEVSVLDKRWLCLTKALVLCNHDTIRGRSPKKFGGFKISGGEFTLNLVIILFSMKF